MGMMDLRRRVLANSPYKATASGSIATFQTAVALPMKVTGQIVAVQDLHGQANPYPAGGGKNLLNTAGLTAGTVSDTSFSNATKRTFTENTYVTNVTANNYYLNKVSSVTVSENSVKFTTAAAAYGVAIVFKGLVVGSTYTISATKTNGNIGLSFYEQDGTFIQGGTSTSNNNYFKTTVPANAFYCLAIFNSQTQEVESSFTDIQLEAGQTATAYAPYSNICPISGRTEANTFQTGENLIPLTLPSNSFKGDFATNSTTISSATYATICCIYVGKNQNIYYQRGSSAVATALAFADTLLTSRTGAVIYNAYNMTNRNNNYYNSGDHPYLVFKVGNENWYVANGTLDTNSVMLSYGTTAKTYSPRKDRNTVSVTFPAIGKNLLSPKLYSGGTYNASVGTKFNLAESSKQLTDNGDGTFTLDITAKWTYYTLIMPVVRGTTYHVQMQASSTAHLGRSTGYLDEDFKVLTCYNTTNTSWTLSEYFTPSADGQAAYYYIVLTSRDSTTATVTLTEPQIELGSSATAYEPYTNTVYGGNLVINEDGTGVLTVDWTSFVADGSSDEAWTVGSNIRYYLNVSTLYGTPYYERRSADYIKSDKAKSIAASSLGSNSEDMCCIYSSSSVCIAKASISNDVTSFKAFLSNSPIQICYKLATPLIFHLANIGQLKSLKGINNVWTDTGDVSVEYWKL